VPKSSKPLTLEQWHYRHSTGGGEGDSDMSPGTGNGRVSKAVLISAIPPTFMKSDSNLIGCQGES